MKHFFVFLFTLFTTVCSSAQETSLEVDCQNPGWLSSLINYGNQQTVQNLKVTGYINSTDLTFIGELIRKHNLNGVLDLEDANIVGTTDNVIDKGYFSGHLVHLLLPKSLVSAVHCLDGVYLDSLTVGGEAMPSINGEFFYDNIMSGGDGIRFNKRIKNLIIREGVIEIQDNCFYNNRYNNYGCSREECKFSSITLPTTLKKIGKFAFKNCFALARVNLPDSIEKIDNYAFLNVEIYTDTLRLPQNLKEYYLDCFAYGPENVNSSTSSHIYLLYEKQHIYVPEKVELIDATNVRPYGTSSSCCYLHLSSTTPPALKGMTEGMYKKGFIAYVPKGCLSIYKSDNQWKNVTIFEEPNPAQSINIVHDSLKIAVNNSIQLSAIVLPEDADSKAFTWRSSNYDVASVTSNGMVTGLKSGKCYIYVTLDSDNEISDSCVVNVYQPVSSIQLNESSKSIKVGESFELLATVFPEDADNKEVVWSSDNVEMASVENGHVTAKKPGVVNICVSSEENKNIFDCCELSIIQPVTGISLNYSNYTLEGIGETMQLQPTVYPEDASNKEVNWRSSNENVCIVSNGIVVAVGYGVSVIIATTADGGFLASCTITVEDTSGINDISMSKANYKVYTLDGKEQPSLKKGFNLILLNNGFRQIVFVK